MKKPTTIGAAAIKVYQFGLVAQGQVFAYLFSRSRHLGSREHWRRGREKCRLISYWLSAMITIIVREFREILGMNSKRVSGATMYHTYESVRTHSVVPGL